MVRDEWAVREPHPALRHLVSRYLGYTQYDNTLEVHRGLPSRHVTLIISLDRPIRLLAMPGSEDRPGDFPGLISGIHAGPALIAQDRYQSGLHLELNPLGVRTLFGMPAAELSGEVVDIADLGVPGFATLPERLRATPGWAARFDIVDEVLRAGLAEARPPAAEIGWAWRRMLGTRGTVRVGELAAEVGWSRRHLGERFKRELGLAPKQAARVLRFERAGRLLRSGARIDLAEVAVTCGYYDQAHLTNEWRALAGCPPGVWIAEELPSLPPESLPATTAQS